MSTGWWSAHLKSELSQGDIVSPIVVGSTVSPISYLQRGSGKSGGLVWQPGADWTPDNDGMSHYLARGRLINVVVISHDCEIDKKTKGSRILVAPISPLETVPEPARSKIVEQRRFALMPLPDVPSLGAYYADLRTITSVDRKIIDAGSRIASMSDEGVARLQVQLIGFITRRDFSR